MSQLRLAFLVLGVMLLGACACIASWPPRAFGGELEIPAVLGQTAHASGSLVEDKGTIYFIVGNTKVPFTNWDAFVGLGYSPDNVVQGDLSGYRLAETYFITTADAEHPWGSWVLVDATIYYSHETGLLAAPSWEVFLSNGGHTRAVVKANEHDRALLNRSPHLPLLVANDPRVYSAPQPVRVDSVVNVDGTIYFVTEQGLYGFPSEAVFLSWSYSFGQVVPAQNSEASLPKLGLVSQKPSYCGKLQDLIQNRCVATESPPAPSPTFPAPTIPTTPTTTSTPSQQNPPVQPTQPVNPPSVPLSPPPAANTRSFYMGFSTWPPDMEVQAIEKSFELTNVNSDIRLVHFDGGVPWMEMAASQPLPQRIQDSWNYTKSKQQGKKLMVAITPLNFERTGMALYANATGDNQPLPGEWSSAALDGDVAKQAYLNYAETVVEFWNPDFLAIGIEVNIAANKDVELWLQYLALHKFVYEEIKKKHPQLPVFATIQLEHFKGLTSDSQGKAALQKQEVTKLLQYADIAALSVYPYYATAGALTENYFNDIQALGKPLAISETGWPSKNLQVLGTSVSGSENAQAQYVEQLLGLANRQKFVFVINWVNVDYTKLLAKLPPGNEADTAQAWLYNGFWNDNFTEKPALQLWRQYFQLQRQ